MSFFGEFMTIIRLELKFEKRRELTLANNFIFPPLLEAWMIDGRNTFLGAVLYYGLASLISKSESGDVFNRFCGSCPCHDLLSLDTSIINSMADFCYPTRLRLSPSTSNISPTLNSVLCWPYNPCMLKYSIHCEFIAVLPSVGRGEGRRRREWQRCCFACEIRRDSLLGLSL